MEQPSLSQELQALPLEEHSLLLDLPRLLYHLLRARGNLAAAILRWFSRLGVKTRILRAGPFSAIFTLDPALIQSVLVRDASRFPKTRWERRVLSPAMNGGLIILEGEDWKEHHRTLSACFSAQAIARLPAIARQAAEERLRNWTTRVNIGHETLCMVNQVLRTYFLDAEAGRECTPFASLDELARVFDQAEKGLEKRVFHPAHLGRPKRGLAALCEKIRNSIGCPIHRAAARNPTLQHLREKLRDDEAVVSEIETLAAAGLTTGHLLTWVCELLSRDVRAQARLRQEVRETTARFPDGIPLSEIEAMPYLTAVINEGLRLYPPAPFLLRTRLDSGEKTLVFIPVWGLHRHPSEWEDPDRFWPERWLAMSRVPTAFIPFGTGTRACIGKRFALIESRVVLIEILRRFELAPIARRAPRPVMTILTRPHRDVWVSAYPLTL